MSLEKRLKNAIRHLISKKHLTYADIADRVGMSESSVKRTMTSKKMTLGDFETYCKSLGFNPVDVFQGAHEGQGHLDSLSLEQEGFLCRNPKLDYIFLRLSFGFSSEVVADEVGFSENELRRCLKKLERYGLLRVTSKGSVVLLKRAPFRWIKNGPFEKVFGGLFAKFILSHFAKLLSKGKGAERISAFEVYLRKETYSKFQRELDELIGRYRELSRTEMSMESIEDLKPYSFIFASDQIDAWKSIYLKRL